MKKYIIVLLTAIIALSLVLVGCEKVEQGSDNGNSHAGTSSVVDTSSGNGGSSSAEQGGSTTETMYPDGLPEKLTVLFQGDSITDNNRSRDDLTDLGGGYAAMVAKALKDTYGSNVDFTFINRAKSGWNLLLDWNKDGVDHYEEEFYQYDADITTILIGYNDIMDFYAGFGAVSDEDFERCYRALIAGLKAHGTMPVCLAPFDIAPDTDYRTTEFESVRTIIRTIAAEYNVPFIDMKPYMLKAVEDGAYKMELFGDLTHPWAAGCRIISELIVDKISALIDKDHVTPTDLGEYKPLSTTADNADDLTNCRVFFANAHGRAEYDDTVYYNAEGVSSTKSLKAYHDEPDPVSSNAYLKVLFDYSALGKKDITKGTLSFYLKLDNLQPWFSLYAVSGYTRSSQNLSDPYGLDLTDSMKVDGGWYKINVNLAGWAARDNTGVLKNSLGIILTTSKLESNEIRQRFGVDGQKTSVMWIDDLMIETPDPSSSSGGHENKDAFYGGQNYVFITPDGSADYATVSFDYTIEGGTYANVVILDNWGGGYGYYKLTATGLASNYTGVTCVEDEYGFYHVTINLKKATDIWSSQPDTVNMLFIRGAWSDADGYIDNIKFNLTADPDDPSEPEEPFTPLGPQAPDELPSKLTILFQGDSITDNGRNRSDTTDLGGGYAAMAAAALKKAYGDDIEFTFINRGNSGWNLIDDWNAGGVDHYNDQFYVYNANIATILIGYNDIMDSYSSGGVSDEQFASCYRALLEGLKARGTIAVCLAPYDINPKIQYRVTEFEAKRSIIHDLAVEYNVPFIDMKPYMTQALADGASKMELFGDLTHPWAAGCRIISELVVDKISLLIDKDYSTPADLGKYRPLTGTADNADDLTNLRAFLATSQGELSYDTAVYYTKDGFTSAKSLKAAIVNPDPVQTGENAEQANSYIRVLFDYSLSAKRNLTSGTLKFDVKLENAEQWVMLQSYSDLTRHNSSCSAFYTVQLSDGTQSTALGDGWYEITVDLANWAAQDNSAALTDSVALIVTASKGMTAQARTNAGIDGKLPTVMWIDNLVIECETIPLNRQEFVSGDSLTILAPEERAYTSVSFDYIITDGEYFQIVLLDNAWKCGYGYFKFNADGAAESYANVTCTKKADGYYHVTITIAEGTKVFSAAPEAIGLLYLRGSWSNAGGYIQNLLFLS